MLPFSQHGNVPGLGGGVHHLDVFFVCLLQTQERSNGAPVGDAQCDFVLVVSTHKVVQCAVTRITKQSALQQITQRDMVSHF